MKYWLLRAWGAGVMEVEVCSECFALTASPQTHKDWHKGLRHYLTTDRLDSEQEAQAQNGSTTHGQ